MRWAIALALACALVVSTGALAGPPHRGHGWGHHQGHGWGHHYRPSNPLGGVLGGILGGWLWSQATRPGRDGEDIEGDLEPWSKAWFGYCTKKYRSFNPMTGEYLGFDGERRFCR